MTDKNEAKARIREHVRQILKKLSDRKRSEELALIAKGRIVERNRNQ